MEGALARQRSWCIGGVVPIHQSCRFRAHTRSNHECMYQWNNRPMFLSFFFSPFFYLKINSKNFFK